HFLAQELRVIRHGLVQAYLFPSLITHADEDIATAYILESQNVTRKCAKLCVMVKMESLLVIQPLALAATLKQVSECFAAQITLTNHFLKGCKVHWLSCKELLQHPSPMITCLYPIVS